MSYLLRDTTVKDRRLSRGKSIFIYRRASRWRTIARSRDALRHLNTILCMCDCTMHDGQGNTDPTADCSCQESKTVQWLDKSWAQISKVQENPPIIRPTISQSTLMKSRWRWIGMHACELPHAHSGKIEGLLQGNIKTIHELGIVQSLISPIKWHMYKRRKLPQWQELVARTGLKLRAM